MSRSRSIVLALVLTILSVLMRSNAVAAQEREPVPSEEAQAKALALVKEVYGEQWDKAETPAEKQALADKLIEQAAASADLTNRYVLLKVACDVASGAGDVTAAFRAIERTAEHFDIDRYLAKGRSISQAARTAKSREQHQAVADRSLALIEEAVHRDDFAAAKYLAKLAADSAREARDTNRLKGATAIAEEVEEISQACEQIKDFLTRLRENPVDPEANSAVGEYNCFMKANWEKGLPMLALGFNAQLRELATLELETPVESADQVRLGDAWWDRSQQEQGTRKQRLAQRAEHWYQKSLPAVTGLVKQKVEKRLEEIAQLERPMLGSGGTPTLPDDDSSPKITLSAMSMQRNRKAAQWVLQIGGKVTIRTLGGEAKEIGVHNIEEFPNEPFVVEGINFHENKVITDGALANMTRLAYLKALYLSGTKTTDSGLRFIGTLTNLEYLYLGGTRVSDRGLVFLSGLTNLRHLGLYYTKVTDAGVPYLIKLTKLEAIKVGGTRTTDQVIRRVLPNCTIDRSK